MLINDVFASRVIQARQRMSHKGTFGRVLLIGGCYPYGGAIIMAALACVYSGAGLVTVATEKDNISSLHSQLPEAMAFDLYDVAFLKGQMEIADVILIGSGLGETRQAREVFQVVLEGVQRHQTLIIDGSALNLLADTQRDQWQVGNLILTPHQKEWERLSGLAVASQNENSTQATLGKFPENTVLVAKSHATKIYQGQQIAYLEVGGPHQAIGGMGDTLAGLIAGLVAQFPVNLFATTATATYLHSAIADELGQEAYIVLPTAISKEIPKWMKRLSGE
ncbi:NAD(P)H-hydrate dehydratase [Streptococcus minor]|uniref:ADP-dependent (S)-NAD(P)H-hydrate dehydratase n=1 Tax=Streptococcus minor TaxID=229549 RepID=A0A3P1VAG3_9STRE|nr:NAD(P)H-hydrate dehydratase [Streptococcus minor]RRD31139.1 NAD(P)H-hydrate dehydratase [Streptococcus minor]